MDMLGHHHVAQHRHAISSTDDFQSGLEQIRGLRVAQVWKTLAATEGEKVKIARLLVTVESAGHDGRAYRVRCVRGCDGGELGSPQSPKTGGRGDPAPVLRM